MEDNIDHIDELIGKYLAGETSADEYQEVESWIAADKVNQQYFDQIKIIFDQSNAIQDWQQFDTDAAWNELKQKLHPRGKQVEMKSPGWSLLMKIAASILMVCVIGFGFYQYYQVAAPQQPYFVQSKETVVSDTLPDGSKTFLNKESKVAYAFDPKTNTRSLTLEGEAFFDVVHDQEKEFVIEVADLIIEDIGTTFNVKAYPESEQVEVYVESGEVAFYSRDNVKEGLRLVAGETGIYRKDSKSFEKMVTESINVLSYKTHSFNFPNVKLGTIVNALNEIYDKKVSLAKPELAYCAINVSFENESLETICEIIAETLGLTVQERDGEFIIDGPGCDE